jgi:hypothetical protein
MKKVVSTQRGIAFVFCPSPITIDKRSEWGDAADNLQQGPNGAFLKMADAYTISHLVQPNETKTAPVGWVVGSEKGLFDKQPIWVDDVNVLTAGDVKKINTLDGPIRYTAKEPAMVCYNDVDGKPNLNDGWVQTLANLKKNYILS